MGIVEDFIGSDAYARLPKRQETAIVPVKEQGGVSSRMAKVAKEISSAVAAYPQEVRRGGVGVALNIITSSLGLLPDADILREEYQRPEPESLGGKIKWAIGGPRRVVSSLLVDKKDLDREGSGVSRLGRQLQSEVNSRVTEHARRRSDETVLLRAVKDFLGHDAVQEAYDLFCGTQFRSGKISEPERSLAVEVESDFPEVDHSTVKKVVRREFDRQILGIGKEIISRQEHQAVRSIIRNPNSVGKVSVDGQAEEKIVLLRQTAVQQLLARIFGAEGYDGRSIAGGSSVYVDKEGSVVKKVGRETEVIASSLAEILPDVHTQPEFRSAVQIAEKQLNLGPISWLFRKVATMGGLTTFNVPGMIEIQRTGADERDFVTVTNVQRSFARIASAVNAAQQGAARLKQIEEELPVVKADEPTFRAIEKSKLRKSVIGLPRTSVVTTEASRIRSQRIEDEKRVFEKAGLRYPPSDRIVDAYSQIKDGERDKAKEALVGKIGDPESAEVVLAVFERRKKARGIQSNS